jgi:hypothetical protein
MVHTAVIVMTKKSQATFDLTLWRQKISSPALYRQPNSLPPLPFTQRAPAAPNKLPFDNLTPQHKGMIDGKCYCDYQGKFTLNRWLLMIV